MTRKIIYKEEKQVPPAYDSEAGVNPAPLITKGWAVEVQVEQWRQTDDYYNIRYILIAKAYDDLTYEEGDPVKEIYELLPQTFYTEQAAVIREGIRVFDLLVELVSESDTGDTDEGGSE